MARELTAGTPLVPVVTQPLDQADYSPEDTPRFLDDKAINVNQLPAKLKSGATGAKSIVYVRSDERVPFGAFASVMDAIKLAGITNISIVTRPIEH